MIDRRECESYLSQLHAEHGRLEFLRRNVDNRFRQSGEVTWPGVDKPNVAAQLGALRDELSKHLDEEAYGGVVAEAVARLPSLATAATELESANIELRQSLENLMHIVACGTLEGAYDAFSGFSDELRLHEMHEEALVERGFNTFLYD